MDRRAPEGLRPYVRGIAIQAGGNPRHVLLGRSNAVSCWHIACSCQAPLVLPEIFELIKLQLYYLVGNVGMNECHVNKTKLQQVELFPSSGEVEG